MDKHFDTYSLDTMDGGLCVIYGNGHSDNPSNSLWIVIWPEGYWS